MAVLIESCVMKQLILMAACVAGLAAAPMDQKGVEFAKPGGHALLLDLHVPDGPGPFPAAILVHGGGFDAGSRSTNMSPTSCAKANRSPPSAEISRHPREPR